MVEQTKNCNERDISSSDDELEKRARRWVDNNKYDNNINENDWSLFGNDELSHHHKEPENFKDLDWIDVPDVICNMDRESMNRFDRRTACYYKEKLLSIKRQLTTNDLVLRPVYKGN